MLWHTLWLLAKARNLLKVKINCRAQKRVIQLSRTTKFSSQASTCTCTVYSCNSSFSCLLLPSGQLPGKHIFWINHELFNVFNDPGETKCDNWLFEGLTGIQVFWGPEHDVVKMLIENYSRKAMWAPSSGGYPCLDALTTQRPTDTSLYSLRQKYLIFKQ